MIDHLNTAADAWTWLAAAVLWQSTLLAGVIALAAWCLRRSGPNVRYWLWQVLAIKLLLMPFWSVAVPLPSLRTGQDDAAAPTPQAIDAVPVTSPADRARDLEFPSLPQPTELDIGTAAESSPAERLTWQAWLMLGWLLVALALAGRIAWQRMRLARFLRRAQPADESILALVEPLARELGLKRAPRVVTTSIDCSPFVCGMWRPVLVLPRGLAESLDETQFRHVLLHELAHVRRRDLVWGWIPEIARITWWFHPVVYWMTARLRLERELACDQVAMWHTDRNAAAYAKTLYRVVSRQSEPTTLKAAAGTAGLEGKETLS